MAEQAAHIVIVPTPGMGHIIPLVEFAKRLIQFENYNFSVTFIIPYGGPLSKAQIMYLDALPSGINYTLLPPVNFDDLDEFVRIETRIALTIVRSLPSIREAVRSLVETTRVVALVVDLFGTDAFDVAKEFSISPYMFFPSTAMCLSFFLYLPELDQKASCEYRDMHEPAQIPGCIPLHGKDLFHPVQDRQNDAYKWVLHHARRIKLAEALMVNTFMELEPGPIRALQDSDINPPIYPIGPLVQNGFCSHNDGSESSDCLKWLDDQPLSSVLYVCFGSGGTLSNDQLIELAMGLELSEQRFIWVVRSPDDVVNATYFDLQKNDPLAFLPKGFIDRVEGRGFLVPDWAPQANILSHGSTGGFLTHCGWNSTLESVVNGVPSIAWPLYAEQRMNAVMLNEGIKVALRPETNCENGFVGRNEIAKVVRSLIEGEDGKKLRNKMKYLKDAAKEQLSPNGSSKKSLVDMASKWNSKISS